MGAMRAGLAGRRSGGTRSGGIADRGGSRWQSGDFVYRADAFQRVPARQLLFVDGSDGLWVVV